ncbi:MAG: TetR/AcrR family transcriptional regulator [Deltaproteobacteria bacterium]|jgi:AcrR family transcriptional regulator|nr:TetR/AcrR family transcriptional regulator [Deltaproteobacteria bacterium]
MSGEDEGDAHRAEEVDVAPETPNGPEASRPHLTGKAATQERILQAATELFLGRGYENTTIAQVAEHADVSRATVFWHFSDKESLFRECFTRLCQPFRESLDRDASDLPPEKRLREQIEIYQSFVAAHRGDVDGFLRWALEHTSFRDWLIRTLFDLHNRFGGALTETIAELVPPHHDPHALAMGILMMLDGGVLLSYFDGTPRPAELRRASVDAVLELIPRRNSAHL